MEFVGNIFAMAIAAIFVQNFVLMRFLGLCPYIGVSKKVDSAFGMGMAVIFVMTMASTFTWLIQNYLLVPLNLEFLQTIAFILTIASLVQLVEMIIQKTAPALYKALGVFLPLITTNCAVLGVAILNINENYNFIEAILNGLFAGLGFTLVLVLMAGIREKLEKAELPQAMKGMPIAMIVAGCMALAFLGFSGLKL
ncbi:MAG: electron transport complex subunit RsxA [Candidatus Cloacimonetes bacterium]|nr:electron transport complex subunit RsxA [Candidatus Cloacimonadota bacterium]MCF7813229.1 electron transport complex subunit RsxA [Candidatus Cloacimonadota bacterium]MCF7867428.1 electron transport complex subunit RsxA [Candidatus Cloacimonadota bacterium]MCF7882940.1 electron transport complex subunit RsxA [Candidatus Cloacimonadota bacterium]